MKFFSNNSSREPRVMIRQLVLLYETSPQYGSRTENCVSGWLRTWLAELCDQAVEKREDCLEDDTKITLVSTPVLGNQSSHHTTQACV